MLLIYIVSVFILSLMKAQGPRQTYDNLTRRGAVGYTKRNKTMRRILRSSTIVGRTYVTRIALVCNGPMWKMSNGETMGDIPCDVAMMGL